MNSRHRGVSSPSCAPTAYLGMARQATAFAVVAAGGAAAVVLLLVVLACVRAPARNPGPDVLCQLYSFGFSMRCVLPFG